MEDFLEKYFINQGYDEKIIVQLDEQSFEKIIKYMIRQSNAN